MTFPGFITMLAAAAISSSSDERPKAVARPPVGEARELAITEANGGFSIQQVSARIEVRRAHLIQVGRGVRLDPKMFTRRLEADHAARR